MSASYSTELLDVARALAPEAGEPHTGQLRRAVSTAYYALFHELVGQATVALCGDDPGSAATRSQVARWFTHSDLRVLAKAATRAGGGVARAMAPVLGSPHLDLARLAGTFIVLQEARNRADYDHEYAISGAKARFHVDRADRAIGIARRLAAAGDGSHRRFLRLMLGSVKIAKVRDA